MLIYIRFQRCLFYGACFLERHRICIFYISFDHIISFTIRHITSVYQHPLLIQHWICVLFTLLSKICSTKMVHTLPFCTSYFIFLFILSICTITINGIYELLNTKSVIDIIMIFLVTASTYAVTKPLIASQKEYTALKRNSTSLYTMRILYNTFSNKSFILRI